MADTQLGFTHTLVIAAVGGIAVALINHFVTWLLSRKANAREARYLAQRLVVVLERFAIECSELVADYNLYLQSKGALGRISVLLPEIGAFPTDVDWKTIDAVLVGRALSLSNEYVLASRSVDFCLDLNGDDRDAAQEASKQAGKCGYRAWKLAVALRVKHKLPENNLTQHTWDFVQTLKSKHDAFFAERKKQNFDDDPLNS
jgi:hypothetical protein